MMNTLYPLTFRPILKDVIWGGSRLRDLLNKPTQSDSCGESWEISGVQGQISVVSNGFLTGNNLQEIIEIYMGELVGDHVYAKFGMEFPLLIKYIDANDILSIQVHPDDVLARERHNAYGKTEMWYIIDAAEGAELISGFNQPITKQIYLDHFNKKTLKKILNYQKAESGDVFFTPAGRIHAIGSGILLAEIQQTSDITYRIYDWDRIDKDGKGRELHTELAIDAIVFNDPVNHKQSYRGEINSRATVADCPYFTTGLIHFDQPVEKDFTFVDSFIIYLCVEGRCYIDYQTSERIEIKIGETVLIPASLKNIVLNPAGSTKLLEVFIK